LEKKCKETKKVRSLLWREEEKEERKGISHVRLKLAEFMRENKENLSGRNERGRNSFKSLSARERTMLLAVGEKTGESYRKEGPRSAQLLSRGGKEKGTASLNLEKEGIRAREEVRKGKHYSQKGKKEDRFR